MAWRRPAAQACLVLLRLAIGWHLLVQGWEKIDSVHRGASDTRQPWTSRGYLQESQGPFAPWFRKLAGDPEAVAQDWLKLPPLRDGSKADELPMPLKLEALWEDRLRQAAEKGFVGKAQRPLLEGLLKAHKQAFQNVPRPMMVTYPAGTVAVPTSLCGQIAYFQKKKLELRQLEKDAQAFGAVQLKQIAELKAETQRLQTRLLKDVAEATAAFDRALQNVLLANVAEPLPIRAAAALAQPQGQIGPLAVVIVQAGWAASSSIRKPLDLPPLADAVPLAVPPSDLLPATDFMMRWGLFVSGILLLLGLFTRLGCVLGGTLLLLIFAAHPPLPGLPDPAKLLPGYTPYVNQTLIEALALFALAFVPSGQWLGLDSLWAVLRRRRKPAQTATASPADPPPASPKPRTAKHRRYTGA